MAESRPARPLPGTAREEYDASYTFYREVGLAPRFSSAWWAAKFYTRLLRRLLPRRARVLDFGCGMGNLLRELEGHFSAWGVDVSFFGVRAALENAPASHVWTGDSASLAAVPPERFDAVIAKHVLEHIPVPDDTVRVISRVLRPGGVFVMAVPNTENALRRLKGRQWIGVKDPTHCSVFPPAFWINACGSAGLAVERTFSDGFWDVPYVPLLPPLLQLPLFGCLTVVQVLLGRPFIPVRLGESFILVARKTGGQQAPA